MITIAGTLIFVSLLLGGVFYYQISVKNRNGSELGLSSQNSSSQASLSQSSISQSPLSQSPVFQVSNSQISSNSGSNSSSTKNSISYFDTYKIKIENVVSEKDHSTAWRQLNQDIIDIKVVQENCHSFTHVIGNAALIKY